MLHLRLPYGPVPSTRDLAAEGVFGGGSIRTVAVTPAARAKREIAAFIVMVCMR
jgi:hypothetical protein